MQRTHLDLFSGIGGFALACRWAGVETIGFAEIDDYASRVLAKNFPGVPNYGDVRNVPGSAAAWLVTGGFPCQPFSVAGKQRGASDDRYLWPEMAGVIERTRPAWVLAENVLGIIKMELDTVLSDLERIGYAAWPVVVPACAIDAQHRRERVWIVANNEGKQIGGRDKSHNQRRTNDSAKRRKLLDRPSHNGGNVANANSARLADGRQARTQTGTDETVRGMAFAESERCGYTRWAIEPNVGRVADGIPNRVDRLRGLGNAIVPQVAYQLIQMMIETEEA